MRPGQFALLLPIALSGCGGGTDDDAAPMRPTAPTATGFPQELWSNLLDPCLDNARNTAGSAVTEAQLAQTCDCIPGQVEQEYSQAQFSASEGRLLGGKASDEGSARLVDWSTQCAERAAR